MLVLENLTLPQHLSMWMPYSSCVCLACESLDIFHPVVFVGAFPNGQNGTDQQLFSQPPSLPSVAQLKNSFFIVSGVPMRPEKWTENSGKRVPGYIFLIKSNFSEAYSNRLAAVSNSIATTSFYSRRCYSAINSTILFPSVQCRAKQRGGSSSNDILSNIS